MSKNSYLLKFNQHLLLSIKIVSDNSIEQSIMRFKLDKEIAHTIKKIPLVEWVKLLEQDEKIFVTCDLQSKQIKRRLAHPNFSLFRLEQILKK